MIDTVYYNRDGITLHCGDNCEVMRTMPKESVDLVVTSPPYDDLRTYGGHSWDFYGVAWNLKRLLKPGGVIVWVVNDATVDGSETGSSMKQALHFKDVGLRLHDTMIWESDCIPFPESNRYQQTTEYMFVLTKGSPGTTALIHDKINKHAGKPVAGTTRQADGTTVLHHAVAMGIQREIKEYGCRSNIWRVAKPGKAGEKHPATFPEALARDHIISWSNEGDTVLDPFSGSGTTIKMARETGRVGIGIEINKDYCDIAVKRLQQRILFPATEVVSEQND